MAPMPGHWISGYPPNDTTWLSTCSNGARFQHYCGTIENYSVFINAWWYCLQLQSRKWLQCPGEFDAATPAEDTTWLSTCSIEVRFGSSGARVEAYSSTVQSFVAFKIKSGGIVYNKKVLNGSSANRNI